MIKISHLAIDSTESFDRAIKTLCRLKLNVRF